MGHRRNGSRRAPEAVRAAEAVRPKLARGAAALARVVGTSAGRRAGLRRLVAGALVAAVAAWCAASQQRAAELRDRWEATEEVVVSRRELTAGAPVARADLEVQARPSALVPVGALRAVPTGPVWALADIATGEVLLEGRTSGAPARRAVPPGRAALEVPLAQPLAGLRGGDRVDLLASAPGDEGRELAPGPPVVAPGPGSPVPPERAAGGGAGEPGAGEPGTAWPAAAGRPPAAVLVAADALVLDGEDPPPPSGDPEGASLTVAVRDEDVAVAAAALLAGPVAVVRRPPPP